MSGVLLLALLLGSNEVLVDQVVAVVDREILTQGDLLLQARVELVFKEGRRGVEVASGELDPALVDSLRDHLINQLLIAAHVRRVGRTEVSEQEVDQMYRRFTLAFTSPDAYQAFCRRFEISEQAIRDILRRNIHNAKYVADRLRSAIGGERLTRAELEARRKAELQRWLQALRENADIRLLGEDGLLERQSSNGHR